MKIHTSFISWYLATNLHKKNPRKEGRKEKEETQMANTIVIIYRTIRGH